MSKLLNEGGNYCLIITLILNRLNKGLRRRYIEVVHVPRIMSRFSGDEMRIKFDGFTVSAPKSRDHASFFCLLETGRFEPFTMQLFKSAVREGMVVCDLGANVGVYTLIAAHRTGPRGKIFAFEPDPWAYRFLAHNIRQNGFDDHAIAVPKAVSAARGSAVLFSMRGSGRSSLFKNRNVFGRQSEEILVDVVTVDEVLGDSVVVDVIKMDVEGAELLALEGMQQTISRAKANLSLFIEYAPFALRAARFRPEALIERLLDLRLDVFAIVETNRKLIKVGSDIAVKTLTKIVDLGQGHINLYCIKKPDREMEVAGR